jgi:hypothetical protein
MAATAPIPTEPLRLTLARKSILLLLIALVVTLGLVIFLHHVWIYTYPLLMSASFADAFLGLVAGLSVRRVLHGQSFFLRFFALVVFGLVSLELLGLFTARQFGLGSLNISRTSVDWLSLGQLGIAVGTGLLSLYAWSRPRKVKETAETPAPARPRKIRPRKRVAKKSPVTATAGASSVAAQIPDPPAQLVSVSKPAPRARLKRKRIGRRKPKLQLSTEEEHRCPYCLELILPDDPRGTVECKICHTLHHADCWAITGACQVPHFTA